MIVFGGSTSANLIGGSLRPLSVTTILSFSCTCTLATVANALTSVSQVTLITSEPLVLNVFVSVGVGSNLCYS